MIRPTTLADQLGAQRGDRSRVLVVGAGVAGLTVAQLLRAAGHHPVLVERGGEGQAPGYMLGLLPFVDPVMRRLGVEPAYLERSVGMHRYLLRGATGRRVREYSLDPAIARFGRYRGIAREALLDVIADDLPVTFGCTVADLSQDARGVRVVLDEAGSRHESAFHAVVGADGLHSGVRGLVLAPGDVSRVDTGWGGWVAWSDADDAPELYEETWGDGFFVGIYPVLARTGVFVGGPDSLTEGPAAMVARVRRTLRTRDARAERALTAVDGGHYWAFADVRSSRWAAGRVALLGDAAAGFLPTAGVGASMAMESAAVLADRLIDASPDQVVAAHASYQDAQRPRVEQAQDASRQLARVMFRSGRLLTRARDVATRAISLERAFGPILRLLADRTEPPAARDSRPAHTRKDLA